MSTSYYNRPEAIRIVMILKELLRSGLAPMDIGIVRLIYKWSKNLSSLFRYASIGPKLSFLGHSCLRNTCCSLEIWLWTCLKYVWYLMTIGLKLSFSPLVYTIIKTYIIMKSTLHRLRLILLTASKVVRKRWSYCQQSGKVIGLSPSSFLSECLQKQWSSSCGICS